MLALILYFILVALITYVIIIYARKTVEKRHPIYKPDKIENPPALNNLDALIDSVKPKQPQQQEQEKQNKQDEQKEQDKQDEQKSKTEEQQKQSEQKQNKIGSRGKPPQRPPTLNLKEAMKAQQILNKP